MSQFAAFGSHSTIAMDIDYYSPAHSLNDFDFHQQAPYESYSSQPSYAAGMRRATYTIQQHDMPVAVDRFMHEPNDTYPFHAEISYEVAGYLQPAQLGEVSYHPSDLRLTSPESSAQFYTDREDSDSISSGTRAYSVGAGDGPNSPKVSPYYNTVKRHYHRNTAGEMPFMPVTSPQVSHMGSHFVSPLQVEHIPVSQDPDPSELDAEGEDDPDASPAEQVLPYRPSERNTDFDSANPGPSSDDEAMSDPNDTDFNPSKRRRKSSNTRRSPPFTTTRAGRHVRRPSNLSTLSPDTHDATPRARISKGKPSKRNSTPATATPSRPFYCPLMPYGCSSTFPSKNEWKRHVSTQHVKLGYWRCELCAPTTGSGTTAGSYNDFNRKDLFMQHLKRMHADTLVGAAPYKAIAAAAGPDTPQVDAVDRSGAAYRIAAVVLDALVRRCWVAIRSLPTRCACPLCDDVVFEGDTAWDERMEHMASGHFEKNKRAGGGGVRGVEGWREDGELTSWLVEEGLVEAAQGGWRIGDGRPRREMV